MIENSSTQKDTGISSLALTLLLIAPICMASNMLVARFMAGEFPPIAMAFWRWAISFLILSIICGKPLWQKRAVLWEERYHLAILGALGMGVCGVFVYIGAETTTATNIGLIYASSPLMITAITALFFGERQTTTQTFGVLLGFGGLVFIVCKGQLSILLSLSFTQGDIWIFGSAAGWSAYSIYLKFHPSKLGTTERLTAITLFGSMILLPFTIWEAYSFGSPELNQTNITAILFLALVPAIAAYLAYSKLQTLVTASIAGLVLFISPVANSIMAWAFLGESFVDYHWIGSLLILPGLWLATRKKKTKRGLRHA